jgi:predicted AAA+ superfamily ATPase
MQKYIARDIEPFVIQNLKIFPAVALLGPRQAGKSTLIKHLSSQFDSFIYLDLQNYTDLQKLTDPFLFYEAHKNAIICIDEIQLMPDLFSSLRSIIDANRKNGQFILLGSASRDIIQKTSESLAGRVGLVELTPFLETEIADQPTYSLQKYWFRGGFPLSFLNETDSDSLLWRENFIRTFIERDIPQFGLQIPALHLRRLLQMCSHNQGQLLNQSKLAQSLDITHPTLRRHIDILEQTYIMRVLQPYEKNVKKRIIKSPKIYIRDSGLLHSFLQIDSYTDLMGNPIFGASWEGFVIENIMASMPNWSGYFYRSSSGDEIDLILEKGTRKIAIECKASSSPQLTKGFYNAINDLKPDEVFVVAPIHDTYKINEIITVCGLHEFLLLQK